MGFGLDRGEESEKEWACIPEGTDVVITHGPPLGHGDLVEDRNTKEKIRAGCYWLLRNIERVQPKVHVFGHIHEGHGVTTDGKTQFVNAAICDLKYTPSQQPIVIDIPLPA